MSSENYQLLASNAALAFYSGRYRESADDYWKAYLAVPSQTDEIRYFILRGCTSTLRNPQFKIEASESDFKNMRSVFENKHELRLFRLEAGYTLALLHYDRYERHKCEEVYYSAISLGEKKLKKERDIRKEETILQMTGDGSKKTMKVIIDELVENCKKNLAQLNFATRGPAGTVFSPEETPTTRITHWCPLGRDTTLTKDMINNLIDVGGVHCDYCKRTGVKLFKCSVCNKGFYCSKECQKKQWKEKEHKKYCRKEGQFEAGDLVQLARLKNKPELDGNILRVVGRDTTSTMERYKVQMDGAVRGDKIISVKPENLNQLRPYDCRN